MLRCVADEENKTFFHSMTSQVRSRDPITGAAQHQYLLEPFQSSVGHPRKERGLAANKLPKPVV